MHLELEITVPIVNFVKRWTIKPTRVNSCMKYGSAAQHFDHPWFGRCGFIGTMVTPCVHAGSWLCNSCSCGCLDILEYDIYRCYDTVAGRRSSYRKADPLTGAIVYSDTAAITCIAKLLTIWQTYYFSCIAILTCPIGHSRGLGLC